MQVKSVKKIGMLICALSLTACLGTERSIEGVAKVWSATYEQTEPGVKQLRQGLGNLCGSQNEKLIPQIQQGFQLLRGELIRIHSTGELNNSLPAQPVIIQPVSKDFENLIEAYVLRVQEPKQQFSSAKFFDASLLSATALEYLLFKQPERLLAEPRRCQALVNIVDDFQKSFSQYAIKQKDGIYPWLINLSLTDEKAQVHEAIFTVLNNQFEFALANISAMLAGQVTQTSSPYIQRPLIDVLTALETANATFARSKYVAYLGQIDEMELADQALNEFNWFFMELTQKDTIDELTPDSIQRLTEYQTRIQALQVLMMSDIKPRIEEFILQD